MKRGLLLLGFAIIIAGNVFAQQAEEIAIGARLGVAAGFHSNADFVSSSYSVDNLSNFNLTFYGYYTIKDNLSIQAEFDFMIGQGYKVKYGSSSTDITYSSLDLPVLVKYRFLEEPLILGALAGPYLSFPMSKVEFDGSTSVYKYDTDGVILGLTLGAYAGYPLGPGRIVGDLRLFFDFNTTKYESSNNSNTYYAFIKRRALALTVGYEYSL